MTIRITSWTLSAALHATFVVSLLVVLGRAPRHASDETLQRLVYVEPAPPAAPPLGSGGASADTAGADVPAPVAIPPPSAAVKPAEPRPAPDSRANRLVPKTRTKPVARPNPAPPAALDAAPAPIPEPAPAAAIGAGSPGGVVGGHGETIGGTRDGITGGTIGGLGTAPVALGHVASAPELVERVMPEYPRRARALEVEGQVILEVVLDRSGRIEDSVRVVRSIPDLDAAAVAAIKQWKFRPARDREGRPVRVVMEVPVRFVLR